MERYLEMRRRAAKRTLTNLIGSSGHATSIVDMKRINQGLLREYVATAITTEQEKMGSRILRMDTLRCMAVLF